MMLLDGPWKRRGLAGCARMHVTPSPSALLALVTPHGPHLLLLLLLPVKQVAGQLHAQVVTGHDGRAVQHVHSCGGCRLGAVAHETVLLRTRWVQQHIHPKRGEGMHALGGGGALARHKTTPTKTPSLASCRPEPTLLRGLRAKSSSPMLLNSWANWASVMAAGRPHTYTCRAAGRGQESGCGAAGPSCMHGRPAPAADAPLPGQQVPAATGMDTPTARDIQGC